MLNRKYLGYFKNRNTYLFLLGLSLSVGDAKLIIATSIFAGIILSSYQIKSIKIKHYFNYFSNIINPQNQKLILSVVSAGTLAIISYLILNIWTEIDNKWLALGMIWQILFSTIGIGLLGWQLKTKSSKSNKLAQTFNQLIKELNNPFPVQRLWAINQIINLWNNNQLTKEQIKETKEYFNLLLSLETETIIINKLNQFLDTLNIKQNKPLNLPSKTNHKVKQKISIIN